MQIFWWQRQRIVVTVLLLVALLVGSVSLTAYAINVRTILLRDDGVQTMFGTTKTDAFAVLRSRGIQLDNDDYLDLSAYSEEGDTLIRIYRAKTVFLVEDGQARQLKCAGKVERLLQLQNVELAERDQLSHPLSTELQDHMEVVVSRAFDVQVRDVTHGLEQNVTLTEGLVADVLRQLNVTLEGEDYTEPALATPLKAGMRIHVNRVTFRERRKRSSIAFARETNSDKNMDLGKTETLQKGEDGETEAVYSDKYVNGQRVDSILLEERVLKEPVKEIKRVGTRAPRLRAGAVPISTLTLPSSVKIENGVPTHYKSVTTGLSKAYSGGWGTASGLKPPVPGYVAVDPKQFPYGTKLWIITSDGKYVYGYAIAADTGLFVKTKSATVDLYMQNTPMARQWGARQVTIYVLDEPRYPTPYH